MAAIIGDYLTLSIIIIYFNIVTIICSFFLNPKLLKRLLNLERSQRNKWIVVYLIYVTILLLLPLVPYYNINFGVFNESLTLFFLLFIGFNLSYSILILIGTFKLSKRELFRAIVYTAIIFMISSASIFTVTGFYFPDYDSNPDWTTFETTFANNTYNITTKVDVETSTYHGFFIDSPLNFVIYNGFVRFNKGNISNDSIIQLRINFHPNALNKSSNKEMNTLTILETNSIKKSNDTYDLVLPKKPWIIGYPYSGSKYISATLLIDGIELFKVLDKEIVYIEKSHVKTQTVFARFSFIFTLWVIFLAFYPIIDRSINWYINTHPSRFWDDDEYFDYIY